jgi:predicted enzyme related to lactoylglutathione lyase
MRGSRAGVATDMLALSGMSLWNGYMATDLAAGLSVGSIVIRVDDLIKQMTFWSQALHYTHREEPEEDWVVLRPRFGTGPNISLDRRHSEVHLPPRIHLDLYARDQEAEVERLLALGATQIEWDRPPDSDFVTLADPEGNRFDVVQV